jgi:hypothetical protein
MTATIGAKPSTWQDRALLILMIAGWTEGLRWELVTAIAHGHARKLILSSAP